MAKAGSRPRSQYRCSECHHVTAKWVGRCPECGTWGTVDVAAVLTSLDGTGRSNAPASAAVPISAIDPDHTRHLPTGVSELDRVLGGGIVPGSVILLAGDPGVGKSTLLLEVVHRWASTGRRALYVSGEESAGQIRMRAERTGCTHDEVYLAAESDVHTVLGHLDQVRPSLVIVDSVQTLSTTDADGVAGGVTQVRAVTTALTGYAKSGPGVAIVLVGHVTKDGAIAGPRSLEHLVDVVLHFEGDRNSRTADGPRHQEPVRRCRRGRLFCVARQRNRVCGRSVGAVPRPAARAGSRHRRDGDTRWQAPVDRRDPGAHRHAATVPSRGVPSAASTSRGPR